MSRRDPEALSRVASDGRQCEEMLRLAGVARARGDLDAAAELLDLAGLFSRLAFATAEAAYA